MKTLNRLHYFGLIFIFVLGLVTIPDKNVQAAGTISLTTMGTAYAQNFDTLANTGTMNNIAINGWYLTESGANANGQYAASIGSDTTGDTYSFGAAGSTERALGGLQTGTLNPVYGASFTNNTGSTIQSLVITYTGEEWRLGTTGRTDQLIFQYSTNATSLITGTWTTVPALTFTTPDPAGAGAKNGNAAGEQTIRSGTISPLNITNGAAFWIRWTDFDATSFDDGLAVDNFSLTPLGTSFISVNTTADEYNINPGTCSLREAITAANTDAAFGGCPAGSGTDIINLPAGTYTLTRNGIDEYDNVTGDLNIQSNLTIQGAGSGSTIINGGGIDRVFEINPYGAALTVVIDGVTVTNGHNTSTSGNSWDRDGGGIYWWGVGTGRFTLSNAVISNNRTENGNGGGLHLDGDGTTSNSVIINSVTFQNNQTVSPLDSTDGGAISILSDAIITISNSTFQSNASPSLRQGGAIFYRPGYGGSLTIDTSTFSGNSSGKGGAISTYTYPTDITVTIQNSQITNNTASDTNGGGLYLDSNAVNTTPFQLTNLLISGNTAATHGGGVYVGNSNVTLVNSRIVNNIATSDPSSNGLYKGIQATTVAATRNWWGCSTGPSAGLCDRVFAAGGTLTYNPWFRDLLTSGSGTTLVTNQSSTLTASYLTNSSGGAVPVVDLARLIGLPMAWNSSTPSVGSLSGTQATIQSSGTATGTFTAIAPGSTTLYARVDNDNTASVSSNVLNFTVNQANTTTSITSDDPDPSTPGQAVTVTFTVTGAFGNAPTAPTGNVTVSDGTDSCTGALVAGSGSCTITLTTPGARTLTATYAGDDNFSPSPDSAGVPHTVNQAPAITSANNVTFTVGTAGSFTVTTIAYPIPAITRGGAALPGGVNFVDNGDGTATLSGTPAAGTGSVYNLTFTASNGVLPDYTQDFTLTVGESPTITSPNNVTFTVGAAGSFTVMTTGFPIPAIGEIGALPAGMTFVDNGNGTATLSGTANAGTVGTYPLTFTASNGVLPNYTQSFTLTVNQASTTTTIDSDVPDPSDVGATVTFKYTVSVVPPGGGTPTGDVTVSNGIQSCTGTVAAGFCTITFTASGTTDFTATYAGDANFAGNTSPIEPHTVNQASTTTTIDSDPPDPSVIGQAVTFSYTVSVVAPGVGTPTGNVTISNGTESCTGTVAAGSCTITLIGTGTSNFTATYAGDANFAGSASGIAQHTVNQADTTMLITSDAPDPSQVGQPVTVTFTVTALAPGAGTPTGDVTVSDGTASCTGTVAVGSCALTFTSLGPKSITASYAGDGNFNASTSGSEAHAVTAASTMVAITSDAPDPSVVGVPVPVMYTVTVIGPGGGTPTGTVTVTDGVDNCTGTVAAGTCNLTMTTTGGRLLTASYSGDANYGGSTSLFVDHTVQGPPAVTLINSNANTGDGQVAENEHTSVAITQLLVVFNKDMNADTPGDLDDALTVGNYSLVQGTATVIPINGVITYNAATHTATLSVNGGVALPDGEYTLTVSGMIEDTLGVPIGTDFVRHFYVDSGHPHHTSIATIPDNSAIINGATVNVSFSSIDITFDEDLNDPAGDIDPNDVTNAENYLLVTPGPDGVLDTPSCVGGIVGDDVTLPIGPVTYTNHSGSGPFVATAQLNGGTALPNGLYRLLICGTTSIVDLAGNPLNGDAGPDSQVDFTVLVLNAVKNNPKTGFAPGVVTVLPAQSADKAYVSLGDLWIEIPKLNLKTNITGVPLTTDGWDVTWLNRQVGWLAGTAYPTWEGNTVLTAHGYTANGEAGPFALLKNLSYGETIIIHLGGMKYTYAVRTNTLTGPNNTYWLTKHEKLDWITLITCQQYDEKTQSYRYRRVVRAVLVRVEEE